MKRLPIVLAVGAVLLAAPGLVAAHALVGRLDSPLPLVVYLAGAAMAVALSFGFVILRDHGPAVDPPTRKVVVSPWLVAFLRGIGLLAWVWIAAQTLAGGSSDAGVAGLFLWVYGWVGLGILSAFVAPVWRWIDPFTTLFDIGAAALRRLGVAGWEPAPYPRRLGAWPAVVGLAVVVSLELVFVGASLGGFMLLYTALTLTLMANYGRDTWRENGETFSVWFGVLNRLAPFGQGRGGGDRGLVRRPYGAGLLARDWTDAHVALVAIGVGSILYDGLSQTRIWFDVFGLPALPVATLQLAAFLVVVVGSALVVARVVGRGAVAAGLVPIAVGYLVAHYATYLLGDGQRIVIALSDPLQLGWDLFGTAFFEPSTDWIPPALLWTLMVVAVVGGHVLGAWSGHAVSVREAPAQVDVRVRQIPLAVLMVVLTATTLWSLGQAVVRDPDASSRGSVLVDGG